MAQEEDLEPSSGYPCEGRDRRPREDARDISDRKARSNGKDKGEGVLEIQGSCGG